MEVPPVAYKSILTVITDGDLARSALEGSIALARAEDGHLDILALGVDHSTPGYYYAGTNALIEQATLQRAREEATELEAAAKKAMANRDCRWSTDAALAQIGTIQTLVGNRARFADLVVLPKPYGEDKGVAEEAVLEAALFAGNAPVLVLPEGTTLTRPRKVVLAWNQSAEAMDAIRAAMPLLRASAATNIVIIDPPRHGPDRSDPGGMLSQMLARQGVRAEISVIAGTMPRTSDVLARHCTDQQADLLVMGAYGHSRFRQMMFGGTTQTMITQTDLTVLFAH